MRALLALLGSVLLLAFAPALDAAAVRSHAAEAELVAAQSAIVPGRALELGLRLRLDPGWHVYWKNAGDSGSPPALTLELPPGFAAGPLRFAVPSRIPIAHLVNFGYEGEVLFPLRVEVPQALSPGDPITITARADWLECKESCLPASARLALTLPVAPSAGPGPRAALFAATEQSLAQPLPANAAAASTRTAGAVELRVAGLSGCAKADFFPEQEGVFVHAQIAQVAADGAELRFRLPLETNASAPQALAGVLACAGGSGASRGYALAPEVTVAAGSAPAAAAKAVGGDLSLGVALVFAFVGGVILNLMPCVFPVLALKVLGLAGQAGSGPRFGAAGRFAAGVLASCLALALAMLALRAAGDEVGWGFQLQSSVFVSALAVLFFLLALNLSGYFEWGFALQALAGRAAARAGGAFFDGVLVVLVASPCTAPLMGAALGYTLSAPGATVLAVFAALGAGIAAPYVLLALRPALLGRLPRSGPWMQTLRQLLAFPLYATVLWLAWVLGEQAGAAALIRLLVLLLAVAFAIWLWRRARATIAAAIAAVTLIATAAWLAAALEPAPAIANARDAQWQAWSAAAVADYRAQGRSVLVDFTAAWCITCQVNKVTVLDTDAVRAALEASGVVALRADWTRRDPEIAQALAALGRRGVPVYALYAPDGRVTLLPEVLTTQLVVDAVRTHDRIAGDSR